MKDEAQPTEESEDSEGATKSKRQSRTSLGITKAGYALICEEAEQAGLSPSAFVVAAAMAAKTQRLAGLAKDAHAQQSDRMALMMEALHILSVTHNSSHEANENDKRRLNDAWMRLNALTA